MARLYAAHDSRSCYRCHYSSYSLIKPSEPTLKIDKSANDTGKTDDRRGKVISAIKLNTNCVVAVR